MPALGFLGAAWGAVTSVVDAADDIIGAGGGEDANRKRTADDLFNAALAGDYRSEIRLRCLAGEKTPEAVAYGFVGSNEPCGFATSFARDYAKARVAALGVRRTVAGAAAPVAVGAAGVAEAAVPGSGARAFFRSIPTGWWIAAGVAVVALIVFARRRGA